MAFTIDGTNGLTFNNATTQASAGQVLQVVQGTYNTQVSTTSNSYVTSNITASITPRFSTSKILVSYNTTARVPGSNTVMFITIYRNSTNIQPAGRGFSQLQSYNTSTLIDATTSAQYLDSPATTSSTSYTIYFTNGAANGQTVSTCIDGTYGQITLMEIAQ
jgi:hypothetical protein